MFRLIIIGLVFGFVGFVLAKQKGRDPLIWFVLCAFIPPLIIAVLLLPALVSKGVTKKCSHCAEIIKEDATICKHCGMGQ